MRAAARVARGCAAIALAAVAPLAARAQALAPDADAPSRFERLIAAFSRPETLAVWLGTLALAAFLGAMLNRRRPAAAVRSVRGQSRPSVRVESASGRDTPREPTRETAEAARLLDFFATRFGVPRTGPEGGATGAIDYMGRLAAAIDRLRARAEAAEARAGALDDALRRAQPIGVAAAAKPVTAGSALDLDPARAAWRVAFDAVRTIRIATQGLRADAEYRAFAAAVGLEDALRALYAQTGAGADPTLVREPWTHALWRADALLTAYYPTGGDWGDLRHGVSVAAAALRQRLMLEGVAVGHVRLLTPYDTEDGESWADGAAIVAQLGPVRQRLEALGASGLEGRLVIDCDGFGYADETRAVSAAARLITIEPAALPAQTGRLRAS